MEYCCIKIFLICLLCFCAVQSRMQIIDRNVKCDPEQMHVFFEFDAPFNGVLYTYDHYMKDGCKVYGNEKTKVSISLPINVDSETKPFCGVRLDKDHHDFSVRLIVSEVKDLLVYGMREFEIQCHYQLKPVTLQLPSLGGGILINNPNNVQRDPSTVLRGSGSGAIPALDMAIREGHGINGNRVQNAHIGQPITLDVFLEAVGKSFSGTPYDIQVYNCIAHDGSRYPTASVTLLDDRGCSTEIERVLSDPVQTAIDDKGNKHIYLRIKGFQFSTSELVYFECQVNPCFRTCNTSQCGTVSLAAAPVVGADYQKKSQLLHEVDAAISRSIQTKLSMDYPNEQLFERVPASLKRGEFADEAYDSGRICMPQSVLGSMVGIFSIAILLCLAAALFVWHKMHKDKRYKNSNTPSYSSSCMTHRTNHACP